MNGRRLLGMAFGGVSTGTRGRAFAMTVLLLAFAGPVWAQAPTSQPGSSSSTTVAPEPSGMPVGTAATAAPITTSNPALSAMPSGVTSSSASVVPAPPNCETQVRTATDKCEGIKGDLRDQLRRLRDENLARATQVHDLDNLRMRNAATIAKNENEISELKSQTGQSEQSGLAIFAEGEGGHR